MKKLLALAATALTATTLVGCGELDPNAIEMTFAGDHIGYYQCKTEKFQPALGNQAGLNSNHWYDAEEFLTAALVKSDILEEAGMLGGLGAAFFTATLFERGSELCAEEGLGQDKPAPVAQAPVPAPAPVAQAPVPAPAPVFQPSPTYVTSTSGDVRYISSEGKAQSYEYFATKVSDGMLKVTYSDGLVVMYSLYVDGTAEIRTEDSEGYFTVSNPGTWNQAGTTLQVVSEKGSVAVFDNFHITF